VAPSAPCALKAEIVCGTASDYDDRGSLTSGLSSGACHGPQRLQELLASVVRSSSVVQRAPQA
jgi:hypothetical protein